MKSKIYQFEIAAFNPIQKFNTFIKKYNNREGREPAKEASSESPEETVHVAEETCYKPKIFTSSNLSKIFLIFNNKKVNSLNLCLLIFISNMLL